MAAQAARPPAVLPPPSCSPSASSAGEEAPPYITPAEDELSLGARLPPLSPCRARCDETSHCGSSALAPRRYRLRRSVLSWKHKLNRQLARGLQQWLHAYSLGLVEREYRLRQVCALSAELEELSSPPPPRPTPLPHRSCAKWPTADLTAATGAFPAACATPPAAAPRKPASSRPLAQLSYLGRQSYDGSPLPAAARKGAASTGRCRRLEGHSIRKGAERRACGAAASCTPPPAKWQPWQQPPPTLPTDRRRCGALSVSAAQSRPRLCAEAAHPTQRQLFSASSPPAALHTPAKASRRLSLDAAAGRGGGGVGADDEQRRQKAIALRAEEAEEQARRAGLWAQLKAEEAKRKAAYARLTAELARKATANVRRECGSDAEGGGGDDAADEPSYVPWVPETAFHPAG